MIPKRVRDLIDGLIAPRDMWLFWVTQSELLGGLTPQQYVEQVGINDFVIALQNGLASSPNESVEAE
jgi:hypothetical protein